MSYWKQKTGTPKKKIISYDHYVYLNGSTDYISTPDSWRNSVTGDIDIRVKVSMDDWTPTAWQSIIGKYNSGTSDKCYLLTVYTTGALQLYIASDGVNNQNYISSSVVPFSNGEIGWIRVTYDTINTEAKYYTSTDGEIWTQLGSTITDYTLTSITDGSTQVSLGGWFNGATIQNPLAGKIYYAEVRDGIDGPIVARFNASDTRDNGNTFENRPLEEIWTNNGGEFYPDPTPVLESFEYRVNNSARNPEIWQHTLYESKDKYMLIGINTWGSSNPISSVTYDGESADLLFKINQTNYPSSSSSSLYGISIGNKPTGVYDVSVNVGVGHEFFGGSVVFNNVDQQTPYSFVTGITLSGEHTDPNITVPSSQREKVMDLVNTWSIASGLISGDGQTLITSMITGATDGLMSYKRGSELTSLGWLILPKSERTHIAVSLQPSHPVL